MAPLEVLSGGPLLVMALARRSVHHLSMIRPVLVVEDDRDMLETLSEALTSNGFAVVQARDGREALTKARARPPSVVLLDLLMPGMSGWEFRAEQSKDPVIADVPVIVLSGTPASRLGPSRPAAFLAKPCDLDLLIVTVESCGGSRRARPGPAPRPGGA
jgi:CheY-like chemotaxis protein